jgi:hypothetical protein
MELGIRATDWWRRRRLTPARLDQMRWYDGHAELPTDLDRHEIAVVGQRGKPKWAVLECPCGFAHRIDINLSAARDPSWRLDTTRLSLFPSIDSSDGERRCHFWLQGGRVLWAADSTGGRPMFGRRRRQPTG